MNAPLFRASCTVPCSQMRPFRWQPHSSQQTPGGAPHLWPCEHGVGPPNAQRPSVRHVTAMHGRRDLHSLPLLPLDAEQRRLHVMPFAAPPVTHEFDPQHRRGHTKVPPRGLQVLWPFVASVQHGPWRPTAHGWPLGALPRGPSAHDAAASILHLAGVGCSCPRWHGPKAEEHGAIVQCMPGANVRNVQTTVRSWLWCDATLCSRSTAAQPRHAAIPGSRRAMCGAPPPAQPVPFHKSSSPL
mmetsp:Transcript_88309/g.175538  ORF Transcript_88309/g.175538 Transcript_88309/m.175538 type:complete len:242 (+) Transcript_88309:1098-1823(+)